jgi:hypothetical protein
MVGGCAGFGRAWVHAETQALQHAETLRCAGSNPLFGNSATGKAPLLEVATPFTDN